MIVHVVPDKYLPDKYTPPVGYPSTRKEDRYFFVKDVYGAVIN
jgi:hypothetical protein